MTTSRPLDAERTTLSHILSRLMTEEQNLENLCKHTPRIASVAANLARIQATLEANSEPNDADALRKALRELESESSNEEETSW